MPAYASAIVYMEFHHHYSFLVIKKLAFSTEILYNMSMRQKSCIFLLVLLILISGVFLNAQENEANQYTRRYQNGVLFYQMSRWQEAAIEFRRAQELAVNINEWSQALYWVILSQMAYSDFGSALLDMAELERMAPNSSYARDIVYHRARVYYIQGYFEDALHLFNRYNTSTSDSDKESSDRRAAAFFWMGECLYSMGQFDEAEKFYAWVIGRYPDSSKIEASAYRLDIIKQKKIENELLALLQWSHEETLRTSEEYQRTIRTYEYTLNLYQRRIAELTSAENEFQSGNTEPLSETAGQISSQTAVAVTQPVVIEEPPSAGSTLIERAIQLENNLQNILRERTQISPWGGSR